VGGRQGLFRQPAPLNVGYRPHGPVEIRGGDLALLLIGVDIAGKSAMLVRTRSVSGVRLYR
jgi:hypothetical protein